MLSSGLDSRSSELLSHRQVTLQCKYWRNRNTRPITSGLLTVIYTNNVKHSHVFIKPHAYSFFMGRRTWPTVSQGPLQGSKPDLVRPFGP